MKKFINKPENMVREMCGGIVLAHPELEFDSKYKIIKKKSLDKNKVTIISGGGSGHEPAHAGFIGKGMIDAAVCGDVFASPSQIQVYQAIKQTASDKGTLLVIKNYSGDMMNFQNAAYLAQEDGINVDYVKVDDDIAVQDSLYTVGRRGVAGTIFVHKIAGAAAQKGLNLQQVKEIAEKVVANTVSIGVAFTSCTVPAKGTPTFELANDEVEYGVGIHGEPGIKREKIVDASEMVGRMILSLCNELQIKSGGKDRVAVLVNGFGATPLMELYLLNNEIYRELSEKGVEIVRSFVGNYMTSIDMAGASISLLKLDNQLEELLNAPCDTPAFKVQGAVAIANYNNLYAAKDVSNEVSFTVETPADYAIIAKEVTLSNIIYMLDVMSDCIIKNEVPFCDLDSHAGDGDFGMSISKGFKQIKREWKSLVSQPNITIGSFLDACSIVVMEHCGGASGPIWGSALRAASKYVGNKETLSAQQFGEMMDAAVAGIQKIGERSFGRGAVVGDKTLIDALVPCANTLISCANAGDDIKTAMEKAAKASVDGAKATENIVARMGRAGTVGERSLGYPDAGAHGLGVIFTEIAQAMK